MQSHQPLQCLPLAPVRDQRSAQAIAAVAHVGSRALRPLDLFPEIRVHCERVEPLFGDFYGVCACGARSLPCVTASDAFRWRCPIYDAQVESLRNDQMFQQRVSDATVGDVVR